MSVLLNLRLVDSLVAPRREQSGAKNIPRSFAPLRHFLSGIFFFSPIPVRYPTECRAFDRRYSSLTLLLYRYSNRSGPFDDHFVIDNLIQAIDRPCVPQIDTCERHRLSSLLLLIVVFSGASLFIIRPHEDEDTSSPPYIRN